MTIRLSRKLRKLRRKAHVASATAVLHSRQARPGLIRQMNDAASARAHFDHFLSCHIARQEERRVSQLYNLSR